MQVCLIGDFSPNLDEGYKNVSHYLADELGTRLEIKRLDVKEIKSVGFWKTARSLRPQIAHLIAQPTLSSLLFVFIGRFFWKDAKIVISALRPEKFFAGRMSFLQKFSFGLAGPDLILVQSSDAKDRFEEFGCRRVELFPNGVDVERFSPVTQSEKWKLRKKYDLDPDLPVILHVGHLEESRNLELLIPLREKQIQVVIAGSVYMGVNQVLIDRLERNGFKIFKGYQPNVEELYQLSDCYVFPLEPGNSLSMPLSVLEAMATNLRVVTTRFKGLEAAFAGGNGLKFVNSPEDVVPVTLEILSSKKKIQTRDQVRSFSWDELALRLCDYYSRIQKEFPEI
jgi:glycosyltransferase involved in cell wall biosynthesis